MQWFREHWQICYLSFVAAVTAFFGFHCLSLRVDQDNRSMDADNAELVSIEERFRTLFSEGDHIFVALTLGETFNQNNEALLYDLKAELASIDGVSQVSTLSNVSPEILEWEKNLFLSEDGKTVGLDLKLDTFSDNGRSLSRIVRELLQIKADYSNGTNRVAIAGLPLQKYEAGQLVLRDQKVFAPLSFVILGSILLILSRRGSGVALPLLVAAISIVWTLGLYSMLGYSLNMITSLLPPVIMTLSITTTIHLYLHWLRSSDPNNRSRIKASLCALYKPCLFASLTTAIGFLSLLSSNTPAVREFGVFASLGVALSFGIGISFLPASLSFLTPPKTANDELKGKERKLTAIVEKTTWLAIRHPRRVIGLSFVVLLICIPGLIKVKSNTDLLEFLRSSTSLHSDTRFIDEQFSGAHSIELVIERKDGKALDEESVFSEISRLQDALNKIPEIRYSMSAGDLLRGDHGIDRVSALSLKPITDAPEMSQFLSHDRKAARISIRVSSMGTLKGGELTTRIEDVSQKTLSDHLSARPAGSFYRVIVDSNQIVLHQIKSFTIALILILFAIGIIFRSARFVALAFIPNICPLIMTAAIMGYSDIFLSTGTTMIASVVIGVAVDDTIHYLSAFRTRIRRLGCDDALLATARTTGLALVSTTLALSAGFWVAIFGSFQPTVHFALLSGLTMWFALLCDLLILPACLKLASSRAAIRRAENEVEV